MSAILAVCGESFCAMVSDGRLVEEPITGAEPKIISEDVPKVRKINRNVVVGFAGDTLAAVQIINALDQYNTQYLTLEKIVKILCQKAPSVRVQPVGVRLLVGGRNRKGQFVLTTLGSAEKYVPQTQPARAGAYLIEGACSHTAIAPRLEAEVKPQAAGWRSLDDVAHTLDACIAHLAEGDKSVNTHYFRELVM